MRKLNSGVACWSWPDIIRGQIQIVFKPKIQKYTNAQIEIHKERGSQLRSGVTIVARCHFCDNACKQNGPSCILKYKILNTIRNTKCMVQNTKFFLQNTQRIIQNTKCILQNTQLWMKMQQWPGVISLTMPESKTALQFMHTLQCVLLKWRYTVQYTKKKYKLLMWNIKHKIGKDKTGNTNKYLCCWL